MKSALIFLIFGYSIIVRSQDIIVNISGRNTFSLNGKWNYIIDPYENGYYDYRYEPYDKNPNPYGGYFLDRQPSNKSELLEYDFEKSPTLTVPGDWNSLIISETAEIQWLLR